MGRSRWGDRGYDVGCVEARGLAGSVEVSHPAPIGALHVRFRWPESANFRTLGVHNYGMTGAELQMAAALIGDMA